MGGEGGWKKQEDPKGLKDFLGSCPCIPGGLASPNVASSYLLPLKVKEGRGTLIHRLKRLFPKQEEIEVVFAKERIKLIPVLSCFVKESNCTSSYYLILKSETILFYIYLFNYIFETNVLSFSIFLGL